MSYLPQWHCEQHLHSPSQCYASPPWSVPLAQGMLSCSHPAACRAARLGLQWVTAPQAAVPQAGTLQVTVHAQHLQHFALTLRGGTWIWADEASWAVAYNPCLASAGSTRLPSCDTNSVIRVKAYRYLAGQNEERRHPPHQVPKCRWREFLKAEAGALGRADAESELDHESSIIKHVVVRFGDFTAPLDETLVHVVLASLLVSLQMVKGKSVNVSLPT